MIRSLFPFRRLLATTFLVVFVNVFVGQCWCATLPKAAVPPRAALAAKSAHGCCKSKGGATARALKAKAGAHKSGKHSCCREKSASLLSALSAPAQKQLLVPAPALLPTNFTLQPRPTAGRWSRTGPVCLVPPRYLPPKIPDIRIFIQSLTV
ncbi:hypothetical protein SAMN02745146_2097 [Hymenobacter daecheongensis DSM 21074]|uniref:Uncharacterized protein n=1 Tax=Hymenobacter daecheongensis DSM 21074 TaxID=1121955 RepID=A0A1M6G3F7_9BACT|nr:hypothetical protein [Hymenobacter daecheongensis]SHJ04387.1 hypothetical protein SAMN02745146_2097 [Hymenobacter daecheongensis DSM 21074]